MQRQFTLAVLLSMAAAALAHKNSTHTPKTHPTKDTHANRRKVKTFNLCNNGQYVKTDDDDVANYYTGYNGLFWISAYGACGGGETIAWSSSSCAPGANYINVTNGALGGDWLSIYYDNLPPLLECTQSFLFTTASSKASKPCGKSEKYGDIYNTIRHDFVLAAPTGDDADAFKDCVDYYTDDDDDSTYFGKSKLVDVDYEQDDDVYTFNYKGLGWNPFSSANTKSSHSK